MNDTARVKKTEAERLATLEQWRHGVDGDLIRGNDLMDDLRKEIASHGIRLERIDAKATLAVVVISLVSVAVIGCVVGLIFKETNPTPITVHLQLPNEN